MSDDPRDLYRRVSRIGFLADQVLYGMASRMALDVVAVTSLIGESQRVTSPRKI